MSLPPDKRGYVNRARMEARRMPWPEYIEDPRGDEMRRLQRELHRWRLCAVVLLVACVFLLYVASGGRW
jgi:hypothetical protein